MTRHPLIHERRPTSGALALALAGLALVAAPAEASRRERGNAVDVGALADDQLLAQGRAALERGDGAAAAGFLAEVAAREPRNGTAHTLLGIAHHLASDRDPQALDLALAGYDLALRAEPGQFWAAAMAGRAAYDRGRYDQALDHFARAWLLRPGDARTAAAVASAAYMAGDAPLAALAAARAAAIDPGVGGGHLRLAALAAAAAGQGAQADAQLAALRAAFPEAAAAAAPRVAQLMQTFPVDPLAPAATAAGGDVTEPAPDQIAVDVTIILAQNTRQERNGVNLLDGLGLQYGFNRQATRTISINDGTPSGNAYQRTLTASLTVPQLSYNLNLFNRGGQYYSVVARPQLTAWRGEQSEFFIGRTLRVAVGGVNLGSLESIDIGIEMKVTPIDITAEGARLRIETGRSFLTADRAGNFAEALTTFRQRVAATAEVRFGETLMLAGLNEAVEDRTFSATPVLGDLPLIGNAFNQRNRTERRDSVIVLVTPSRPTTLAGRPFARPDHVGRLTELWTQVIDPASNAEATVAALRRQRHFTRMMRADAPLAFPDARGAVRAMLADLAPAPAG